MPPALEQFIKIQLFYFKVAALQIKQYSLNIFKVKIFVFSSKIRSRFLCKFNLIRYTMTRGILFFLRPFITIVKANPSSEPTLIKGQTRRVCVILVTFELGLGCE